MTWSQRNMVRHLDCGLVMLSALASLFVSERGGTVTFILDTSRATYHQPIKGIVGGDCGLLRDFETDEVIGIELRVIHKELSVFYDGPLKINEGFLKDEVGSSDQ